MTRKKYLSEYFDGYIYDELECAQNRSPHTIKSYATSLKLLIIYLGKVNRKNLDDLHIADLNFDNIHSFLKESRRTKAWRPATWNNRLAGIKAFISYLALIDVKFLELLRRVNLITAQTIPVSEPDYLTAEQIRFVLSRLGNNNIEVRDRALICMFFSTGIRNAELTNMKHRDLKWKSSSQIRINILGKGRKKRSIPLLDKSTIQCLRIWVDSLDLSPSDHLFCTRNGSKMSEANVRRIITKYFLECYPNKNITPHSLRHSAAMNWLHSGVDIFTISSTLGHARIKTTQHYARSRFELKEQRLAGATNLDIRDTKFKSKFKSNDDLIKSLNMRIARLT